MSSPLNYECPEHHVKFDSAAELTGHYADEHQEAMPPKRVHFLDLQHIDHDRGDLHDTDIAGCDRTHYICDGCGGYSHNEQVTFDHIDDELARRHREPGQNHGRYSSAGDGQCDVDEGHNPDHHHDSVGEDWRQYDPDLVAGPGVPASRRVDDGPSGDQPTQGSVAPAESPTTQGDSAVDHPKHYNSHPADIEAIDVIEHMGFNIGTAMKYLWRAGLKDGEPVDRELMKARWYIERELQRVSTVTNEPTNGGK